MLVVNVNVNGLTRQPTSSIAQLVEHPTGNRKAGFESSRGTQGRVVRKPISANLGLKVNREFNFFYIKVF